MLTKNIIALGESVSNGKTLVANAITAKGVNTSTSATFDIMASNISQLKLNDIPSGNVVTHKDKSANTSLTVENGAKYLIFSHKPGTGDDTQVTSGATVHWRKSVYKSCTAGQFGFAFFVTATATSIKFSHEGSFIFVKI